MQTTSSFMRSLLYDPNESYENYCLRRQHALEQGRQAVRERRISGDLYLFYEYLIERVGGNRYTWVGEDTLAEVFQVDASTIKRWIAKLVRAGLIRRQRQFATSSRTYITAYDPTTILLDCAAEDTTEVHVVEDLPVAAQVEDSPPLAQEDRNRLPEAVSFRRTDAPTFGADLRRDLKDSHLRLGGGGRREISQNLGCALDIRQLLEREGVSTFYLAPQLQQRPLDELRAVSRYLDQQHNVRDRARLFAALAVQGFGGLLLAGRVPHGEPSRPDRGRPALSHRPRVDDPQRYVSGALAPYIQGVPPQPALAAPLPDPGPIGEPAECSSTTLHTWQQALETLRSTLTPSEFDTWVKETTLVLLEDGQAVIGTPNIFAREKLETPYFAQRITEALYCILGQPVGLAIVIGG